MTKYMYQFGGYRPHLGGYRDYSCMPHSALLGAVLAVLGVRDWRWKRWAARVPRSRCLGC